MACYWSSAENENFTMFPRMTVTLEKSINTIQEVDFNIVDYTIKCSVGEICIGWHLCSSTRHVSLRSTSKSPLWSRLVSGILRWINFISARTLYLWSHQGKYHKRIELFIEGTLICSVQRGDISTYWLLLYAAVKKCTRTTRSFAMQ